METSLALSTIGPTAPAPASLPSSLFSRWIAYLDAAGTTVETYTKAIRHFAAWLAENGIEAPRREDVLAYRAHLAETGKAAATIRGYLVAVRLFFRWTETAGAYRNIADHIKGAKLAAGFRKDYLTSKQAGRFLRTIDRTSLQGKRDFAICSLMATAGLRTIEVIRANVEDLRAVADSPALFIQRKGHAERDEYVKLAPPVEEAIADYMKARGPVAPGDPLFSGAGNRSRGRLTTRSISRLAKAHLQAAGLDSPRLTAHSLRHTAATLNLLNGGSIEETQQLLGHRSITTTLIYSHALDRARNDSENRIARAIFGR